MGRHGERSAGPFGELQLMPQLMRQLMRQGGRKGERPVRVLLELKWIKRRTDQDALAVSD